MADLLGLFETINEEVIQLSYRWKVFRQLFDSGPENLSVLNKSGSYVFGLLQTLMIDDTILALSRLTDTERSMGRENASLKNLLEKSKPHLDQVTRDELTSSFLSLNAYVQNLRVHRNKVIAHKDLSHALGASSLPNVRYDDLENSMEILRKILTDLGLKLFNQQTCYEVTSRFGTDGEHLLSVLRKARK